MVFSLQIFFFSFVLRLASRILAISTKIIFTFFFFLCRYALDKLDTLYTMTAFRVINYSIHTSATKAP